MPLSACSPRSHAERRGRCAAPGRGARRARLGSPSQMLMPLAFAASAGALLVLSGSPVNVSSPRRCWTRPGRVRLLRIRPRRRAAVLVTSRWPCCGAPAAAARAPGAAPPTFGHVDRRSTTTTSTRVLPARVRRGSSLVDRRRTRLVPPDVVLIGVQHAGGEPGAADEVVRPGDVAGADRRRGRDRRIRRSRTPGRGGHAPDPPTREALLGREVGVAEVVAAAPLRPRSGNGCSRDVRRYGS